MTKQPSVTCGLCGDGLNPVFDLDAGLWKDSIQIVINGGYGELIDGSVSWQLCEVCAREFLRSSIGQAMLRASGLCPDSPDGNHHIAPIGSDEDYLPSSDPCYYCGEEQ